jgi:hypothetical protein
MISAAQVEVLSEALALLHRGGVPLPRLMEALEYNAANSGVIAAKLPLMLSGDFEPRFSVKNMLKDLQIALRSVEGKGIEMPATAATAGALMGAVQAGWSEDDFASLARHYAYPGTVKDLSDSAQLTGDAGAASKNGEDSKVDKATRGKSSGKSFFGIFGRSKSRE